MDARDAQGGQPAGRSEPGNANGRLGWSVDDFDQTGHDSRNPAKRAFTEAFRLYAAAKGHRDSALCSRQYPPGSILRGSVNAGYSHLDALYLTEIVAQRADCCRRRSFRTSKRFLDARQ